MNASMRRKAGWGLGLDVQLGPIEARLEKYWLKNK